MRYRGGGVGHKITRSSDGVLLKETHTIELEDEEEHLEPPVGPLAEEEWVDEPDEGDGFDDEAYGFGLESDREEDDEPDTASDDEESDVEDELGAEDGEEPGEDIEGEEGFAPL